MFKTLVVFAAKNYFYHNFDHHIINLVHYQCISCSLFLVEVYCFFHY